MSKKFHHHHHGWHHVWTNIHLTMETEVVFNRDITITDVSNVGYRTSAYFAIAEASSRRILAYAHTPAGDSKTRLTVKEGVGRLILRANTRYIFARWHHRHGDLGWGRGIPNGGSYTVNLENGLTATFFQTKGSHHHRHHHHIRVNPAKLTTLPERNHTHNIEFNTYYSAIPYFWWEEVVTSPASPASVTTPATAQVGRNTTVSWASVPLPTQPSGVTLQDRNVYYEVDFFNGESYRSVASKTTATSLSYVIPKMPDRTTALFRVRAFIEVYGARHYGAYRTSSNIRVTNNTKPTVPNAFTFPTSTTVFTIGRSYTITWGVGFDADGDTVLYDLDYFDGDSWKSVLKNGQSTNRTFHVPNGPNTLKARFRVRSSDGKEYSDYRYSSEFKVESNIVPRLPKPFSNPQPDEMRYVEETYPVTWGAVENEQNEDIRYEVQFRPRQIDNWTSIRTISNQQRTTSITHAIPNVQDSANAQYRVRAYDGLDYGDWQESSFFKITGNRVTNTRGFNEELKARYAVNQEVRLTWSTGSTVRNSPVLYDFEIFDGFNWHEVMYDMPGTSIIFRIPKMNDTTNARFRIRTKTRYDFGGYVFSDWFETRPFTVVGFFKYDNIVLPYPNDIQKKENVDYLRLLVNDMRIINELPPFVFTDEVIIRYETVMQNVHFDEIEQGILDCYDTNPNGRFNNSKTETEMREIKLYADQQELLMDLPQRLTFILRSLMNI